MQEVPCLCGQVVEAGMHNNNSNENILITKIVRITRSTTIIMTIIMIVIPRSIITTRIGSFAADPPRFGPETNSGGPAPGSGIPDEP